MKISLLIEQVAVLFLIALIGMVAAKKNIINLEARKKLSELLLYVASPLLIVSAFNFDYSPSMLKNAGTILIFSLASHVFGIVLGNILFKKYPEHRQKILRYIIVFSNCGYMGLPVLDSLFGKTGVFYGSIYNAVFNIFMWTYGVALFRDKKDKASIKKILFNPGIIAVIVGMVIFLFSIKLPSPIMMAIDLVGGMTTPLSMLIVGAILASMDLNYLFRGFEVYYASFLRLIFIPIISIIALKLLAIDTELLRVSVVLVAMPAASNTVILAEQYGADSKMAAKHVALSTILSIITIPLIMILT